MKEIQILHTNDIHSSYEQFVKIAYKIKQLKNENTIVLDAGDFNDFSSFITKGSNGEAGLILLNKLGYDALTIGNNEGFQSLEIIKKNCKFNLVNILSCNLFQIDGSNIDGLKPSIIKEVDGVRFLIVGVSPYMPSYNTYYNVFNLKALPPFDLIENEIKENKGKYDFVILLSHLGLKNDIMITQCINNIDIIISGHSHHVMNCVKVNGTYIHQSGYKGSHLGVLKLKIDDNKICEISDSNIIINDTNDDDVTLLQLNNLKDKAIENLSNVVTYLDMDLNSSIFEECNLTNLLADYLFNNYKCDFSMINSGLTETNLLKGKITLFDVINCCKSPLYVSLINVKGKYINEALRQSSKIEKCYDDYRRPGFRGKYLGKLHLSYNCNIVLSNNKAHLLLNNQLIENDKYYKIVTTDYFLRGMGYVILKNNVDGKMYSLSICDALINALKDKKSFEHIDKLRWESGENYV